MKLKLVLTIALLCAAISPSFAQDTLPPDTPVATETMHQDAGPAIEAPALVVEAPVVVAPTPETAAVVTAPAPVQQTAISKLSDELMSIIIPAFSSLILGLVATLLLWLRKKFKLEVSNQTIYQWSDIARKAVSRGDEWARNKAKGLAAGVKVPGPEILEVSLDWAVMAGKSYGLADIGREKLIGLIESQLHMERVDPSSPRELESTTTPEATPEA